jgi:AraC family transcriptional regulator
MAKRKSLQMNARRTLNPSTSSDEGFSIKQVSLPMMQVEHCRLPASAGTPKHFSSQHFMTVHLNPGPVVKELKLNDCLQRGSFGAGDICLTPAATPVSSVNIQEPSELVALHIEPTFLVQTFAEIVDPKDLELVPQFKLQDPLIHQMAIALKAQIESSEETWNRLYVESMVTAICVHLSQRYSTQKISAHAAELSSDGLPKAHLGTVLEYIHEHADQNLSLLEMAQQVQMSPYYFSRLFKQSTGLSPHQYLISHRIQQTKRLLATTKLSIAEIAAQAGFTDQSHLARHFKRQLGVPPSQFR